MKHKDKQEWIEAVMADTDLTAATKVFAYGIFKHMYGLKDTSHPGTEALEKTTGLSRSKFPSYRKGLIEAGYLSAEVEKGRVYHYTLSNMYLEGTSTCTQKEQHMYPEGTTHVPNGGTNTTKNTTTNPTREDINSAIAPVDTSFAKKTYDPPTLSIYDSSFEGIVTALRKDGAFAEVDPNPESAISTPSFEEEMKAHRSKWAAVARQSTLAPHDVRDMAREEAEIEERHGVASEAW